VFHNWLIPLSVIITLGTVAVNNGQLMFVAYISLFGLFYLIGYLPFFRNKRRISNGYSILGSLGTIGLLLFLSFEWFWTELDTKEITIVSPEFFVSVLLSLAAILLLFWKIKNIPENKVVPMEIAFIAFIL